MAQALGLSLGHRLDLQPRAFHVDRKESRRAAGGAAAARPMVIVHRGAVCGAPGGADEGERECDWRLVGPVEVRAVEVARAYERVALAYPPPAAAERPRAWTRADVDDANAPRHAVLAVGAVRLAGSGGAGTACRELAPTHWVVVDAGVAAFRFRDPDADAGFGAPVAPAPLFPCRTLVVPRAFFDAEAKSGPAQPAAAAAAATPGPPPPLYLRPLPARPEEPAEVHARLLFIMNLGFRSPAHAKQAFVAHGMWTAVAKRLALTDPFPAGYTSAPASAHAPRAAAAASE